VRDPSSSHAFRHRDLESRITTWGWRLVDHRPRHVSPTYLNETTRGWAVDSARERADRIQAALGVPVASA
jgi:hypothetical protein